MWFKIQKPTFIKLYRYYLYKMRKGLWFFAANALQIFFFYILTLSKGEKSFDEVFLLKSLTSFNNYKFSLLLSFSLTINFLGLLGLLYYATRQLNGVSGWWKSKRSQVEDSHILLFACPITRQTIVAAKFAAFATYWGGVNLVGLIIPACLVLALNTQISFLTILSFFFLAGFFFSLVNFFCFALPSLYAGVASGKMSIFTWIYLAGSYFIHQLVYLFLPWWASFPLFLIGIIAGGYFSWEYWKTFQKQDLG